MDSPDFKNETTLFLFTAKFPYGDGETFLENEIKILSKNFSEICIFPLNGEGVTRQLPVNARTIEWKKGYSYHGKRTFLSNFKLFWKIMRMEFLSSPEKRSFLNRFGELKSSLLQNISKAMHLSLWIQPRTVYYTFWFDDWATILGILYQKNQIGNYHSRAHGFDLYAYRRKDRFIPFREFQMRTVKHVYAVSNNGANYLRDNFPQYESKIKTSYLGVFDNGKNPFESGTFTLVSCSALIPLKRVHLIISILKHIRIKIRWVHFGDGPLIDEIREQIRNLNENVETDLRGKISNADILKFYKNNSVNLFINTSETEGLPVSIQEAMSFGIPVLATDVGGVSEIVNEHSGFLIKKNFNAEEVAHFITAFRISIKNSDEFQNTVRNYWQKYFNADVNYSLFCKQLMVD